MRCHNLIYSLQKSVTIREYRKTFLQLYIPHIPYIEMKSVILSNIRH